MIIENSGGGYDFIRGIGPFSAAVRARTGYAIVHATLTPILPLDHGYATLERHLAAAGRPIAALCGIQLRIPHALSREGFEQFNRPYIEKLRRWGLEVEGANPVARTNVALESNPVAEGSLASFFYTIPADGADVRWLISGVPEMTMRDGAIQIVAPGDTSAEGMRKKTEAVLVTLDRHLSELAVAWSRATTINLYTVHDLHPLMVSMLLPKMGGAQCGISWHHARPPVTGLELEIDAWSVLRTENVDA